MFEEREQYREVVKLGKLVLPLLIERYMRLVEKIRPIVRDCRLTELGI